MEEPLVSICIPTYKKPDFVLRCLRSIAKQDYKNIEVIISDDSPDEGIKHVAKQFAGLRINYIHNGVPLKSPANWNAAIDKATGAFFMLLHQDDWLHAADAISIFVYAFRDEVAFVFCCNIGIDSAGKMIGFQRNSTVKNLYTFPEHLIVRNVIGPPSNVMLRLTLKMRYDEQLIWLVDIDYYIRLLNQNCKYHYINKHLVSIGIHDDQTTGFVKNNKSIILKENIILAAKAGNEKLTNLALYDYYWRLLRNFNIRSHHDLARLGLGLENIPDVLKQMVAFQSRAPRKILHIGIFSKSLMVVGYIRSRLRENK